jgi:hypothetical protein
MWLVNKINDQILEVIECLNDINSSIYGLSGIVGRSGQMLFKLLP